MASAKTGWGVSMTVMRLKGINKVKAKGRTYYYHRATGTRIEHPFGSAEFIAVVKTLNAQGVGAKRHLPKSWGALAAAYRGSPEFTGLADLTKRDYHKVFNYLAGGKSNKGGIEDMPIALMDTAFVIAVRDKAYKKHKRRFANYVVQVIRLVFTWGKPRRWSETNPGADAPLIRRPRGAPKVNRAWTPEEKATVLREAQIRVPHLLPGIGLGMFGSMPEGDMVRFTWPSYDGTAIRYTRRKNDVPVTVKVLPELKAILAAEAARQEAFEAEQAKKTGNVVPLRKSEHNTILRGKRGRPYTEDGFRSDFFKFIRELEAEGLVGDGLTFHGLRHTMGKELREAKVSKEGRKAIQGHKTDAMADHYSDEADRSIEAFDAIDQLEKAREAKTRR